MNKKVISLFLYLILAILFFPSINANPLNKLIESYDFDFNNGDINILSYSDYMLDLDSDGTNDTLFINFTANMSSSADYYAVVSVDYGSGIVENETYLSITPNIPVSASFSTAKLVGNKWNYSVELLDENKSLDFMRYAEETGYYEKYEAGDDVYSVSDSQVSSLLRLTLGLNVSLSKTANVSVTLSYDGNTISKKKEVSLTTPTHSVEIDFDNETIKSTHWNNPFVIEKVSIGNKVIDIDENTSSYDYEDFAETSYIKDYASTVKDYDSDNLSDVLEINFTVNIKETGTYNISYDLYDEYDNYVTSLTTEKSFGSTGIQAFQTLVNGSRIYSKSIDGPYLLSFAKLSGEGITYDVAREPYSTETYYFSDFERPPQPDLVINMSVTYSPATHISGVVLNLTNIGEVQAVNVWIDLFDNGSYQYQNFSSILNTSTPQVYYIEIQNTTNDTLITAIADFYGYVDESDESNNIVSNVKTLGTALQANSLTRISATGTESIFEFTYSNPGATTLTDVSWGLATGDGSIWNNSILHNFSTNEEVTTIFDYNYSSEANYTVIVNITAQTLSDWKSYSLSAGEVLLQALSELYNYRFTKVFSFIIENTGFSNKTSLDWNINTGQNSISSTSQYSLNPNENITVIVEDNYTAYGHYEATAKAIEGGTEDSKTINTQVQPVNLTALTEIKSSGSEKTFYFEILNYWDANPSIFNWTIDTGIDNIKPETKVNLSETEAVSVIIEYNYSSSGSYVANATAFNGTGIDYAEKQITI